MRSKAPYTRTAIALCWGAAAQKVLADSPLIRDYQGYQAGEYGMSPNQSYHTLNSTSPLWQINTWKEEPGETDNRSSSDGSPYIFFNFLEDFEGGAMVSSSTPMIFSSSDLSLVWAGSPTPLGFDDQGSSLAAPTGMNPQVQNFGGGGKAQPYLTYWGGSMMRTTGLGYGKCFMFNEKYELEYVVEAVDGSVDNDDAQTETRTKKKTNAHSCLITPEGKQMMLAVYDTRSADLTSVGGPENGTLLDSLVQVVDIESGELKFEWRSSDYYPLDATYIPWVELEEGYDWFHMNSLDATLDGNYLISSRQLSSVSYVNGTNGDVIWTLGGKHSDFTWKRGEAEEEEKIDGQHAFMFQHNVHVNQDDGMSRIYMFDNHSAMNTTVGSCTTNCSRGLVLEMDYDNMSYKILTSHPHPTHPLQSATQGSHYRLPNGNALVGWGANPGIAEYSSSSSSSNPVLLDVQFGRLGYGPDAYRVYKGDWFGMPTWDPKLVVVSAADDDKTTSASAWVSWNGATEVREWVLTGAKSKEDLLLFKTEEQEEGQNQQQRRQRQRQKQPFYEKRVKKVGFEMSFDDIPRDKGIRFLQVAALDSKGVELRKSDIVSF